MTVREVHLWLARAALQQHLRAAERVLPAVAAALPIDRRARAMWAFGQLKEALEGRDQVARPSAAAGDGA